MGHLHALGPTGGPGGEDDVGEVVRSRHRREGSEIATFFVRVNLLLKVRERHNRRFENIGVLALPTRRLDDGANLVRQATGYGRQHRRRACVRQHGPDSIRGVERIEGHVRGARQVNRDE